MDAKIERVAAIKLMDDVGSELDLESSIYKDKWVKCEQKIEGVIEDLIELKVDPLQNELDRANARIEELEDELRSLADEINALRSETHG